MLAAITPWLGAAGLVVGGLAAVAGWLTGSVRKSVAEARDRDIAALDRRVQTLEGELAGVRAENAEKDAAIKVLLAQQRGDVELQLLVRSFHEMAEQLGRSLASITTGQDAILAELRRQA